MKEKLTLPNLLTSLRILGALVLPFCPTLSLAFYIVYSICGLSDGVDGFAARKTGQVTEFGSKLDSVADLLFYAVMLLTLLPVLIERLPVFIWPLVGVVVVTRLVSYLYTAIRFRRFASLHTIFNKASGASMFFLPYMMLLGDTVFTVYAFAVVALAEFAAAYELVLHTREKE